MNKENSLDKVLELFSDPVKLPMAIKETFLTVSKYEKPSNKWSLNNQLIMFLHGTSDARGYKQWLEVDRTVKFGAKAFYILGPIFSTKRNDADEDFVPRLIGFKDIPVFRYEDTEGKELPEYGNQSPIELPPLYDLATKMGIDVKYHGLRPGLYGYFTSTNNEIVLGSHDPNVFFHELAHAVHYQIGGLKHGQHPDNEVVAETVAAVLSLEYGYDGYVSNAYTYLKGYVKDHTEGGLGKEVVRLIGTIQAVLDIVKKEVGNERGRLNV